MSFENFFLATTYYQLTDLCDSIWTLGKLLSILNGIYGSESNKSWRTFSLHVLINCESTITQLYFKSVQKFYIPKRKWKLLSELSLKHLSRDKNVRYFEVKQKDGRKCCWEISMQNRIKLNFHIPLEGNMRHRHVDKFLFGE